MTYLIAFLLLGALSPLIVVPWVFMLGMIHALGIPVSFRGVWDMRDEFGTMPTVAAIVFGAVGLVFNVIFSMTWGTAIYLRPWNPLQPTFSLRTEHELAKGRRVAEVWARRINKIWPGHID